MANENFGLGFTVEGFSQWADPEAGTQGPHGEIAIFIEDENQGPHSEFLAFTRGENQGPHSEFSLINKNESQGAFGEIVYVLNTDMQGAHGELNTQGLCAAPNILSAPGQSFLSGPSANVLSCP